MSIFQCASPILGFFLPSTYPRISVIHEYVVMYSASSKIFEVIFESNGVMVGDVPTHPQRTDDVFVFTVVFVGNAPSPSLGDCVCHEFSLSLLLYDHGEYMTIYVKFRIIAFDVCTFCIRTHAPVKAMHKLR